MPAAGSSRTGAVELDAPAVERLEAGDGAQRGGLAGAVGPEQRRRPRRRRPSRSTSRSRSPSADADVGAQHVSAQTASQRSRSGTQHGQGHGDQHQRQGDGGVAVGLEGEEHGERHGLGPALEVAGEGDRGAELAEGPGPAQHGAGDDRRARRAGRVTRRKIVHRLAPEGGGGVLVAAVGGAEPGLDGDHQERHGHERVGGDHAPRSRTAAGTRSRRRPGRRAGPGARRRTAGRRRRPPAGSTIGRITSARTQRPAREPGAGQHPGQRDAERAARCPVAAKARGDAEAQGVGDDRVGRAGRRGRATAPAAAARRTARRRRPRRRPRAARAATGGAAAGRPPRAPAAAASRRVEAVGVEDLLALVGQHERRRTPRRPRGWPRRSSAAIG